MIELLAGLLLGIVIGVSGTVFVVLMWAVQGPTARQRSGYDCDGERD